MTPQSDDFESFSLLAVDDAEFAELDRLLVGHPTIHLQDLVVDDPTGRLLDEYPSFPPSTAVWDGIELEIAEGPTSNPRLLDTAPSAGAGGRRRGSFVLGAVAAAVVLVAAFGAMIRSPDLTTREVFAAEASTLARQGDSAVLTLNDPVSEAPTASVVVGEDGIAFFVFGGLDTLDSDQTYQLWAVVDGEVVSAALLGSDGGATPIRLEAEPEVLAVTIESAGGVVVSEQPPVAVWAAEA